MTSAIKAGPELQKKTIKNGQEPLVTKAEFVAGATTFAQFLPPASPEVAFAGRSNVGKSSLMNMLMSRKKLVRTSSTPGATRQINFFEVSLDSGFCGYFVDLPGFGYAKVSKSESKSWNQMMDEYLLTRVSLRALVLLCDVRRGYEQEEFELIEYLKRSRQVSAPKPLEFIFVATKLDKLVKSKQKAELDKIRHLSSLPIIGASAKTGEGREQIWKRCLSAAL